MRLLALIFAVLLCAAPARAGVADDPLTLIVSIYKVYQSDSGSPGYDNPYSKRLQGLRDAVAESDAGLIDWDVFVNGNDWVLSDVQIKLVAKSAARAKVHASFKNFKKPQDIMFDLVFEDGRWRIDDIASIRPGVRWTMSKILTRAPDAFPDEKRSERK